VGLGHDSSANTAYAIDYAFSFSGNGAFEIRETGTYRAAGTFAAADVFTIAVAGTTVTYYRNGILVYTSLLPVTTPLVIDTTLQSLGAGVTSAAIVK
jgi:hypothetical protein